MNHPTPSGATRPVPGQDKEEPELSNERDIPTDDDTPAAAKNPEREDGTREVERE
jgi:hypothetical protein